MKHSIQQMGTGGTKSHVNYASEELQGSLIRTAAQFHQAKRELTENTTSPTGQAST